MLDAAFAAFALKVVTVPGRWGSETGTFSVMVVCTGCSDCIEEGISGEGQGLSRVFMDVEKSWYRDKAFKAYS